MTSTTNLPVWLYEAPPAGPPIRVQQPMVSVDDAVQAPIQMYPDMWLGEPCERVIRFVALCATCARPLWAHDDLRDGREIWSTAEVIAPGEFGKFGPTVAVCVLCSHGRRWSWAFDAGSPYWSTRCDADDANVYVTGGGGFVVDPERSEFETSTAIAFSCP